MIYSCSFYLISLQEYDAYPCNVNFLVQRMEQSAKRLAAYFQVIDEDGAKSNVVELITINTYLYLYSGCSLFQMFR